MRWVQLNRPSISSRKKFSFESGSKGGRSVGGSSASRQWVPKFGSSSGESPGSESSLASIHCCCARGNNLHSTLTSQTTSCAENDYVYIRNVVIHTTCFSSSVKTPRVLHLVVWTFCDTGATWLFSVQIVSSYVQIVNNHKAKWCKCVYLSSVSKFTRLCLTLKRN